MLATWDWLAAVPVVIFTVAALLWVVRREMWMAGVEPSHEHHRHHHEEAYRSRPDGRDFAIEILPARYAGGEISADQFTQSVRILGNGPGFSPPG